jgi:hypothetical protein
MRASAKRVIVAAVAVLAFGVMASTAGATMTWSGSAPWTATSGTVSLSGGLSSCDSSVLTLDNPVSLGAGLGGTGQVTDAAFDGCSLLGNSASVTADSGSLPWSLSVTPGSPDGLQVTGVHVTLSGSITCHYAGSLTADSWTGNDTATFTGASGLTKQSGSNFFCPSSPSFAGTYVLDGGVTVDPS